MNQLYIVIERNNGKGFSPVVAVCSELRMAYTHWRICMEGSVKHGDNLRYEIVSLSLDDVDKLIGAVEYLKNKIKEELENVL